MTVPATLSDVPDVTPYRQFIATGGQTVFPYPFPITQDADLIVVVNGVTLATDSGYTISGVGNDTGGNVTFSSGAIVNDVVTVFRDIAIERLTQFGQNSGFASEAFNAEFNNVYLILQQLNADIAQCLRVPNTNSPAPTTLLTPSAYASKYQAYDANGNPVPAVLTVSGAITLDVITSLTGVQTPRELAVGVTPVNKIYDPGITLRYGGAADGSGVTGTDNTTAIHNAFLANDTITMLDGSYLMDTIIVDRSDVTFELGNAVLLFKAHTTSGNCMFQIGTAATSVLHVNIYGGTLEGNKANQTFASEQFSHGVQLWGSHYCKIKPNVIRNTAGDGVNVGYQSGRVAGSNGNTIEGINIYGQVTSPQRQCVALVYGCENSIIYNKCSGTIDIEMNLGVGEIKNNLIHGNRGRNQTESLLAPRLSDLKISLASLNTNSANYDGNIISHNHCKQIVLQYNSGTTLDTNVVTGSDATQICLIDIAGGDNTLVKGNKLNINAAVATSIASALRTRGSTNLTWEGNPCKGDTASIPYHAYSAGFGIDPNAAGHVFRNNQTDSGYYRNTNYPFPSEPARFKVECTAGVLTITQLSGVKCYAEVSNSGANLVLGKIGNAGTGYLFDVRRSCNKSTAGGTTARPDICDYVYTVSGNTRIITVKTYTPAVGAISDAAFDFSSGTGTFEIDVLF